VRDVQPDASLFPDGKCFRQFAVLSADILPAIPRFKYVNHKNGNGGAHESESQFLHKDFELSSEFRCPALKWPGYLRASFLIGSSVALWLLIFWAFRRL
jgi:hypothetical protein